MANQRFTFARAKLHALPLPRKRREYYYDEVVRSLALSVFATGKKSFMVYRKLKGRPLKITLGPFDSAIPDTHDLPAGANPLDLLTNKAALNIRKARKLATAVNASLDVGVNPSAEKRRQRQREGAELTLGELFERYREDHLLADGKKRPSGVVWYFERYLGGVPGGPARKHGRKRTKAQGAVNWQDRRISTIQSDEVGRLRAALAKNISPTTANRVMELLKAIFNFGRKNKLCAGENPAADFPKFKLQSRDRRIQSYEARKFFEILDAESDLDFRDYTYLAICTGARRGNLLQMRWDELSLDGAAWRVAGERMKNGDPLVIPLVPRAVEILRRRRAANLTDNPWVFPGRTTTGHAGPFRFQWARFIQKADVPDLRVHDLRRTLGSWMSSTGASTVMTMRALGHKTIDAALVYQRLELAPVRDAMATGISGLLKAGEPEEERAAPVEVLPPKKARVVRMPRRSLAKTHKVTKARRPKGGRR